MEILTHVIYVLSGTFIIYWWDYSPPLMGLRRNHCTSVTWPLFASVKMLNRIQTDGSSA